jgi:hypothetical protein
MPLRIYVSGVEKNIIPTSGFASVDIDSDNAVIVVDPNYYIGVMNMTGK